jgi:hypothetical protein
MTRTAILLFALALVAPPATFAASYEQQSDAIKQCQQIDVNDWPTVFHKCIRDKGWLFCSECQQFGYMLGGECVAAWGAADRPACWYRDGEKPISLTAPLMARWMKWVKNRGWEKQDAPFYPYDAEIDQTKPYRVHEQRGYRDWMKEPLKASCAGSDWPEYCEWYTQNHCYPGPDGKTVCREVPQ